MSIRPPQTRFPVQGLDRTIQHIYDSINSVSRGGAGAGASGQPTIVTGGGGSRPTGIATFVTGTPGESQTLLMWVATHACSWSGRGSAGVLVAPTAAQTISIRLGETGIGTINFDAGSKQGTLSGSATIAEGDVIRLIAPSTLDASWSDIAITLLLDVI